MTACLVLNILLSFVIGEPDNMSHPGLVSFGHIGVHDILSLVVALLHMYHSNGVLD